MIETRVLECFRIKQLTTAGSFQKYYILKIKENAEKSQRVTSQRITSAGYPEGRLNQKTVAREKGIY